RQQHEVVRLAMTLEARVALEAIRSRDVCLGAEDRLYACLRRLDVEIDGPVQGAVIGERERRHAQLLGTRAEVAAARRPSEKAVLAVRVEVDELLDGRPLVRRWWKLRGASESRRS